MQTGRHAGGQPARRADRRAGRECQYAWCIHYPMHMTLSLMKCLTLSLHSCIDVV